MSGHVFLTPYSLSDLHIPTNTSPTCLDRLVPTFQLFLDKDLNTMGTHTARVQANEHTPHCAPRHNSYPLTELGLNFLAGFSCLCGKNIFSLLFNGERKC